MSKHKHRYHRSGTAVAIGLPGKHPSREARQLAASPLRLPPGLWRVSDHAVPHLSRIAPVISEAIHHPTGAHFTLASLPDGPFLAISPVDGAAFRMAAQYDADPTDWANKQRWQIQKPRPLTATLEDGWIAFGGPDTGPSAASEKGAVL